MTIHDSFDTVPIQTAGNVRPRTEDKAACDARFSQRFRGALGRVEPEAKFFNDFSRACMHARAREGRAVGLNTDLLIKALAALQA